MLSLLSMWAITVGAAATADTALVEYYGPHPIELEGAGPEHGMCFIEGPHFHSYTPAKKTEVLYVHDGPYWSFVGDPTEYEPRYDGPSYVYYGHHPVWWTHEPGHHYCYISGPHHHWYEPAHDVTFVEKGGAYWYTGAHPAWYHPKDKVYLAVDEHYHHHDVIVRPAVVVAPPVGWIGVTVDFGPAVLTIGAPPRPPPVQVIEVHDVYEVHEHHDHHWPPAWGHYKHEHKHKHGRGKR